MFEYKTIFIPIDTPKGSSWSGKIEDLNGDAVSRDIQAAIEEKAAQNYKLHSMEALITTKIISSVYPGSVTNGFILVFEKII